MKDQTTDSTTADDTSLTRRSMLKTAALGTGSMLVATACFGSDGDDVVEGGTPEELAFADDDQPGVATPDPAMTVPEDGIAPTTDLAEAEAAMVAAFGQQASVPEGWTPNLNSTAAPAGDDAPAATSTPAPTTSPATPTTGPTATPTPTPALTIPFASPTPTPSGSNPPAPTPTPGTNGNPDPTTTPTTPAAPTTEPVPTEPPPPMPAGPPPTSDLQLLAQRATFGLTPNLVAEIEQMGISAWLDAQLDPSSIDDSATDALFASYRTIGLSETQLRSVNTGNNGAATIEGELMHQTLLRAVYSKRQLYEVMVDFWNNHFTAHVLGKGGIRHFSISADRDVARANALGRFDAMLLASARSAAMLHFLDNKDSDARAAGGVNENYGRELLELHTLGIIDGQHVYSEADMRAASHVLAGWTYNWNAQQFEFRSARAYTGAVSILGGAWSRPDRSGASAATLQGDGESLLGFLARHSSTARYLAHKMCVRFVGDNPPSGLVQRMAQAYLNNNTAIAPMLRVLFTSAEFANSGGQKVRRGFEVAAGYLRATQAVIDANPVGATSTQLHGLPGSSSVLQRLGQRLFDHASPDGYPEVAGAWLGTNFMLRRWETAGLLCHNSLAAGITVDAQALLPSPMPATASALIDAMIARFAGTEPTSGTTNALLGFLGVGAGSAPPSLSTDQARDFVALCLASPEVQFR